MTPIVGMGTGNGARGWDLWIVSVFMVVLAGFFVAARFWQRARNGVIGFDDYGVLASLMLSVILSITEAQAVNHGYGRHYRELSREQAATARRWFYGAQITYKVVLTVNKMSICGTYYRIFTVSSKAFRFSCHITQGVIVTSGIAFIVGAVFQCRPVAAFWDKSIENAWCFDQMPWWLTYAVLQITLDLVLLFLPVHQVLRLHMSKLEKFGLILAFCTGLFVTLTSIFRATTLAASAADPDPTWGPIPATVWAVVEANSGIIAACLPLLRRPFICALSPIIGCIRRQKCWKFSQMEQTPNHAEISWGYSPKNIRGTVPSNCSSEKPFTGV